MLGGICTEMEEALKSHNSKKVFDGLRRLTRKIAPTCTVVKDSNDKVLTDTVEVLERWRGYCEDLYRESEPEAPPSLTPPSLGSAAYEPEPLKHEVEQALGAIQKGKACGPDEVPIELLQNGGPELITALHQLIVTIWRTGQWPQDWCDSTCVPILKKGDAKVCDNYRTLSLVSHSSKILLNIILERLRGKLELETAPEQAGFRKGRGTQNHLVSLNVLTEKARASKRKLFFCFVDFQKAFDSVNHARLWRAMTELGFSEHLIRLIASLYDRARSKVRIAGRSSTSFHPQRGTRQGCPLSPYLFNLFAEVLMRTALLEYNGGARIDGIRISNLRYADDILLVSETRAGLQAFLRALEGASNELRLTINVSKTVAMALNTTTVQCTVYGKSVPIAKSVKYLGVLFEDDASGSGEFRSRLAQGYARLASLRPLLRRRDLSTKLKARLIQSLVFPIVTYGCEAWSLTKDERAKLRSCETKSYHQALQRAGRLRISNTVLFILADCKPMLEAQCRRRKLSYFGHVVRHCSIEKDVMLGMCPGSRRRGGQRRQWIQDITSWLSKALAKPVSIYEAVTLAQDRSLFRELVHTSANAAGSAVSD